jgi:replication initiation and membrane attachment protein DnaB
MEEETTTQAEQAEQNVYRKGQKFPVVEGETLTEYQRKLNNIIDAVRSGQMDQTEADARIKELQAQEFGPSSFDIGEFEDLLSRLEGSKVRQQRQRSVEGRRDIMTQGLAGMMGNF